MTDAATRSDGRETLRPDWSAIDWRPVETAVFRLQKRIYRASLRGDVEQLRKLQRLLIAS